MWVHRYALTPKRALSAVAAPGPRHGALIRLEDEFAGVHGSFRAQGRSALDGLTIPASHWPLRPEQPAVQEIPDTPGGTGFGFDDLLERLAWKKLA